MVFSFCVKQQDVFEMLCVLMYLFEKQHVIHVKRKVFARSSKNVIYTLHVKHYVFNCCAAMLFSTKSLPLHPIL